MATEYVKIVKHWVGVGNLVAYQVGFCNPFIYRGGSRIQSLAYGIILSIFFLTRVLLLKPTKKNFKPFCS